MILFCPKNTYEIIYITGEAWCCFGYLTHFDSIKRLKKTEFCPTPKWPRGLCSSDFNRKKLTSMPHSFRERVMRKGYISYLFSPFHSKRTSHAYSESSVLRDIIRRDVEKGLVRKDSLVFRNKFDWILLPLSFLEHGFDTSTILHHNGSDVRR